jgi:hypothetical protein
MQFVDRLSAPSLLTLRLQLFRQPFRFIQRLIEAMFDRPQRALACCNSSGVMGR